MTNWRLPLTTFPGLLTNAVGQSLGGVSSACRLIRQADHDRVVEVLLKIKCLQGGEQQVFGRPIATLNQAVLNCLGNSRCHLNAGHLATSWDQSDISIMACLLDDCLFLNFTTTCAHHPSMRTI